MANCGSCANPHTRGPNISHPSKSVTGLAKRATGAQVLLAEKLLKLTAFCFAAEVSCSNDYTLLCCSGHATAWRSPTVPLSIGGGPYAKPPLPSPYQAATRRNRYPNKGPWTLVCPRISRSSTLACELVHLPTQPPHKMGHGARIIEISIPSTALWLRTYRRFNQDDHPGIPSSTLSSPQCSCALHHDGCEPGIHCRSL